MIDQIERCPSSGNWRIVLKHRQTGAILSIIENLSESDAYDTYLDLIDEREELEQ